jgi:CRISPR-associated helicase cas3|nr:MAG TPA: Cas system-associated protein [Caudoviricetes sp.]
MNRVLENEIRGKFDLNEIQEIATTKVGENLIIDAPTASGKTEAILLAIKEGSSVTWMLPTITACTFMYRRLCRDFSHLNVRVLTSVLKEERIVDKDATTINVITCDPYMVEYVKILVQGMEGAITTDPVLVLDELDNYPVKVRTVLQKYLSVHKGKELSQVIIASATLDADIKNMGFETIKFSHISNKIRYKAFVVGSKREGVEQVLSFYKTHKIGFLCNSIVEMEDTMELVTRFLKVEQKDLGVIFHHSRLSVEERLENERRLFENDFDILISNDLVSMSVDVELDLLVSSWSDKLNVMIQRFGRLNRRGKKVNFFNLIIMHNECYPPFINDQRAEKLFSDLGFVDGGAKLITSDMLAEWSNQIELDYVSLDDVLMEVSEMIDKEKEVILRDIPHILLYQEVKVFEVRKKGKEISAEKKTVTVEMKQQNMPWDRFAPYSQEECEEKDLIYLPWLRDVDHPNGIKSNTWIVTKTDEDGRMWIEPYNGPKYSESYDDDYDEDEDGEDDYNYRDYRKEEEDEFKETYGEEFPSIQKVREVLDKLLSASQNVSYSYDWTVIVDSNTWSEQRRTRKKHIFERAFPDDPKIYEKYFEGSVRSRYDMDKFTEEFDDDNTEYLALVDQFQINDDAEWLYLPREIKWYFNKCAKEISTEKQGVAGQYKFKLVFPYSYTKRVNREFEKHIKKLKKEWVEKYGDMRKIDHRMPIAFISEFYDFDEDGYWYVLIDPNSEEMRKYHDILRYSSYKEGKEKFLSKNEFPIPSASVLYEDIELSTFSESYSISDLFRDGKEKDRFVLSRTLDDKRIKFLLKRWETLHKRFMKNHILWKYDNDYDVLREREVYRYLIKQVLAPANIDTVNFLRELFLYILDMDKYCNFFLDISKLSPHIISLLDIHDIGLLMSVSFNTEVMCLPEESYHLYIEEFFNKIYTRKNFLSGYINFSKIKSEYSLYREYFDEGIFRPGSNGDIIGLFSYYEKDENRDIEFRFEKHIPGEIVLKNLKKGVLNEFENQNK